MEQSERKRGLPAPAIAVIVAVVILILAAAAYCGLCKWVQGNGLLLPNTLARNAEGTMEVELGKLSEADAQARMKENMDAYLAQRELTISYAGGWAVLDGSLLKMDPITPVTYGMAHKAATPFLRLGALWLGVAEDPLVLSLSAAVLTEEGEAEAERLAREIAEKVYVAPVGYACEVREEEGLVAVTHGTEGRELDSVALALVLKQALLDGRTSVEAEDITIPTDHIDSQMIYDMVYSAPADPFLQEDGTLSLPVTGVSIDVTEGQAILDAAGPGESCTIPLVYTEPDFSTCQDLLYQDVLAENVSWLDGVPERSFNAKRTADFCDEVIIMPGQIFSYLGTIGDPSVANGYMVSTGYQNGQTVKMEGGGACQVSSALYYCAVYSNLEIVWRANHAFVVTYVPKGLDATVYYPSLDFQFRNNTPYPIKVVAYSEGGDWGSITVKLLGTKQDGTHVVPEINQLSVTPWSVKYVPNPEIEPGTTKVDVTPYTGYTVEVYRCVYDANGKLISRTFENTSRYAKRDRVVLFNPADAEKWGVNPDGTPLAIRTLTVRWVDEAGNNLADPLVQSGLKTGSAYSTTQKEFEGYTFKSTSGDAVSGVMTANRTVTYVYTQNAAPAAEG